MVGMKRSFSVLATSASIAIATMLTQPTVAHGECPPDVVESIMLTNEADMLRKSSIAAAVAKYQQALALAPNRHRTWYKLALANIAQENWPEALIALERAMKLAPSFANYAGTRGMVTARMAALGTSSWADARTALEAALLLDDTDPRAHIELGDVLLHLRDDKGALTHFSRGVQLAPQEGTGYLLLADRYLRLGASAQAKQVLSEGLKLARPDDTRFGMLVLLGQALDAQLDVPGALQQFEAAKNTCGACNGPGQALIHFELGASYARSSPPRKNEALQSLMTFQKTVCKGALAARYGDQCEQAQDLVRRLGQRVP